MGGLSFACDFPRFPCFLESPIIFLSNFQDLESAGNDFGPGKSWKFKLKLLESPGTCLDANIFMICS